MINTNTTYRVTGRYMDGQKLIGYHLVGEDGSQAQESKERVIWAIGRGLITNLRIQVGTDKEIIIRGKGINLNKLPVYDPVKNQFRQNDISQAAANTPVSTAKSSVSEINPMGQYRILKRIMFKNKCLGYELQDFSGNIIRKKRDEVKKLAVQRLICNAEANKITNKETNKSDIILRGVNCDLTKLPILIVDENTGKIKDPSIDKSELTVRSAYMKRSGIIHDKRDNHVITFKNGDYIICGINGNIKIISRLDVESRYTTDREAVSAICDDYLGELSNYSIEILGSKPIAITENMIKSWTILKHR